MPSDLNAKQPRGKMQF